LSSTINMIFSWAIWSPRAPDQPTHDYAMKHIRQQ
jgi:hypothetical protein